MKTWSVGDKAKTVDGECTVMALNPYVTAIQYAENERIEIVGFDELFSPADEQAVKEMTKLYQDGMGPDEFCEMLYLAGYRKKDEIQEDRGAEGDRLMDKFELHHKVLHLTDTHSSYMLAKMLLIEQKERDELAAHVEQLRGALDNILNEIGTHSHDDLSDAEKAALEALTETPATSLARRDLIKQAEVLNNMAEEISDTYRGWEVYGNEVAEFVDEKAKTLRQQANELEK